MDYADKKVYEMNTDDLLDYIMQPQPDGKKNKKKPKKRKPEGGAPEDEAKAKSHQQHPLQHQDSSQSSSSA